MLVGSRKGIGAPQTEKTKKRPVPFEEPLVIQGGQSRKGCGEGLEMGWEVNRGQIAKGMQCPIGKLALLVQPGTWNRKGTILETLMESTILLIVLN